jgi:hypothetical protein
MMRRKSRFKPQPLRSLHLFMRRQQHFAIQVAIQLQTQDVTFVIDNITLSRAASVTSISGAQVP